MWIKICGNTNDEDARIAVESGADALGFVFAPSPRQVTEDQVQRILSTLQPQVETYGVFVDMDFERIVRTVITCELTGIQLHRSAEAALPERLRKHFAGLGRKVRIVRTVRYKATLGMRRDVSGSTGLENAEFVDSARELDHYSRDPAVDAVLVDSFVDKVAGGTGTSFDWLRAQASFFRMPPATRFIVAGGLQPENVRLAISTLRPWGVDVASGVEITPGKKDPARVRAFIHAAREAYAELSASSSPAERPGFVRSSL